MISYRSLRVSSKENETQDSVRVALDAPVSARDAFSFLPGQHLPVQIVRDGKKLRRTYSICSEPGQWPLEIGVRIQPGGRFSNYAANELKVGDSLDVRPPNGQFHANIDATSRKRYLALAAGSGITPIMSIIATLLRDEPQSRVALFYGNRKQNSTMFIDDLFALKNRYPDRLQLHFLFSQEEQEFDIASGRLDGPKLRDLFARFCAHETPDEVFVCGPDTMITTVSETLLDLGVDEESIHAERFGAPRGAAKAVKVVDSGDTARITVILDGHRKSFDMPRTGTNIVDAAAQNGIELPYSCKGGVCATCRTHVQSGKVSMAVNYGLEPWEVDDGFILACQSTPDSDAILLDYDKA